MRERRIASLRFGTLSVPRLAEGRHDKQCEQTEKRDEGEAASGGNGQRTRRALRGGGGYMFMIGGNCVNDVAGSLIVMGKRRSIAPIILAHWKSGDDSRFGSIVPPAGVPSREIVEMPVIAALRSSSCVLNCLRNRGSAIFCQLPLWKKART